MDDVIRRVCILVYDRFLAVIASIAIALVLGTIIARMGLFNSHQLGILSSSVWLCAATYLRYVSPYRGDVPHGLTASFYFTALCILGSTGLFFLPEQLGKDVQASAYVGFGFAALIAFTIIVYAVHEERNALNRLRA